MPKLLSLCFALIAISLPAAAAVPTAAAAAERMAGHAAMAVPPVAVLAASPASAEQLWQLRSGLNVAALMCGDQATVAGYNWLLRAQAPLLTRAWQAEQLRFQQRHGRAWQAAQDRHLTSQYNQLANAPDRRRFCAEAHGIVSDARMVPAGLFAHFAASAVSRLYSPANPAHLAAR